MLTPRLELRPATEADRSRFIELFCDQHFMVFSDSVRDVETAMRRFDGMLQRSAELSFAKQPVVDRRTGIVLGYTGADWVQFEGTRRLEFGYRLVPEARGRGYATEASSALLTLAAETFRGELLAIIHPPNVASIGVAEKLGFRYWKHADVDGQRRYVARRPIP